MDSCVHQRNEEHWNLSIMCFHRCCLKIKARLLQVSFLPPHTRFLGSELNLELKIFPHEMPWQYSDFPASRFSSQRQFILISSVISVHYKDPKSASPLVIFLRFNCTPPSPEIETSRQKLMFSFWVYVFLVDFSRMQKQNKKEEMKYKPFRWGNIKKPTGFVKTSQPERDDKWQVTQEKQCRNNKERNESCVCVLQMSGYEPK